MVTSILVTGAFHEDGFADSCDGFGGGWEKEQVLTIMKDSRVGTYAVIGLVLLLATKFFALFELAQLNLSLLIITLINGHCLSRLGASLAIETLDYVQDIDKSKVKPMTASKLSRNELVCSILFSLPFFICLLFFKPSYLLVLVPLGITFYLCVRYFKKRIGGYTGDCLGALQQLLEVCFYLSVLALY